MRRSFTLRRNQLKRILGRAFRRGGIWALAAYYWGVQQLAWHQSASATETFDGDLGMGNPWTRFGDSLLQPLVWWRFADGETRLAALSALLCFWISISVLSLELTTGSRKAPRLH